MIGVLVAILALLTAPPRPTLAQLATPAQAQARDLRVTDAEGEVRIAPAEKPKSPVHIDEDTPLQEEDVVTTGLKSQAELTLDGETVLQLGPLTRFKVLKIYPNNTQLEVTAGGLIAKVKPAVRDEDAIILKLPTAVVAIRGTELGVETGGGVSHVGVFDEGHVFVGGAWGREHVSLGPNQETHVPLSNVPAPPEPLALFKPRRTQMAQVRSRVAFWRQHWEPMNPPDRKRVRERINAPIRFRGRGFRYSAKSVSTVPLANPPRPLRRKSFIQGRSGVRQNSRRARLSARPAKRILTPQRRGPRRKELP